MDYENPIISIEKLHDGFRTMIRKNCANYVVKFRWIQKQSIDDAIKQYFGIINKNRTYQHWQKLLKKTQESILNEFKDVLDEWCLKSLCTLNLDNEIKNIFQEEWDYVGPPPPDL